jgi:hypothetical protein
MSNLDAVMPSGSTGAPRPLEALAARVAAVAGELPDRERAALALREREGARYEDIAGALGVEPAEVPGLLVAARLEVSRRVRHAPLPPLASADCMEARALLAMRQDGELDDPERVAWLRSHVDGCASCQGARRALVEASLACRAWDGGVAVAPVVVASPAPAAERRRLAVPLLIVGVILAGGAAAAIGFLGGDDPAPNGIQPAAATTTPSPGPSPSPTAKPQAKAKKAKKKKKPKRRPAATATAAPVAAARPAAPVVVAAPQATASPPPDDRTGEVADEVTAGAPAPATPTPTAGGAVPPPGDGACTAEQPDCESG